MKSVTKAANAAIKTRNEQLWQAYMSYEGFNKKIELELINNNNPLFCNIAYRIINGNNAVAGITKRKEATLRLNTATESDIKQEIVLHYIEKIREKKERGFGSYDVKLAKELENTTRRFLSERYTNCGISIPYGSKKRHMKNGTWHDAKNAANVYDAIVCNGFDTTIDVDKSPADCYLQRFAMYRKYNVESELILTEVRDIMDTYFRFHPEKRNIVVARFMSNLQWKEIAKEYGITEGGARFKVNEAFAELRGELLRHGLKKEDVLSCLDPELLFDTQIAKKSMSKIDSQATKKRQKKAV